MNAHWSKVSRLLSAVPTALVFVLWVALWQAWPVARPQQGAQRQSLTARIAYRGSVARVSESALRQLAFVQTPSVDGNLIEMEDPGALLIQPSGLSSYALSRAGTVNADAEDACASPLLAGRASDAVFRPSIEVQRVFGAFPPCESGLTVEIGPGLRERDFRVSGLTAEGLQWTNAAWQVELRVVCAEDGSVEDVFIETATTNQTFNLALARRIQAMARAKPGARCSGTVAVSYGEK